MYIVLSLSISRNFIDHVLDMYDYRICLDGMFLIRSQLLEDESRAQDVNTSTANIDYNSMWLLHPGLRLQ